MSPGNHYFQVVQVKWNKLNMKKESGVLSPHLGTPSPLYRKGNNVNSVLYSEFSNQQTTKALETETKYNFTRVIYNGTHTVYVYTIFRYTPHT